MKVRDVHISAYLWPHSLFAKVEMSRSTLADARKARFWSNMLSTRFQIVQGPISENITDMLITNLQLQPIFYKN